MKAVVQQRYGSPDGLELREVDRPIAGEGQVLVKVHAASVNALDWHLMKRLPHALGRLMGQPRSKIRGVDLAGVVEAVGGGVRDFRPGDEVFGTALGAFAEYAAAREERLALKPRNLSFEQAAAIPVAGCTALQGLRDQAKVRSGQSVLIYGAGGGVGTFAVEIAKALGARVTAVTSAPNLDLMRSIGADEVVDYATEDFTRRGRRHDVVFDLGADRSRKDLERAIAADGKLVLCGAPKGLVALLRLLLAASGSRPGGRRIVLMARIRRESLESLKEMAEAGTLVPVIHHIHPLSEVPEALRTVGTRQARGKVVIRVR